MSHFYGWKPSRPDPNATLADTSGLPVLPEVDPRGNMPPCYDQGELGSCTANAVAGAVHYDNILNGTDFGTPSRLFIYYDEREREGTVGYDSGAYGHDGFKCVRGKGVCSEAEWPYVIRQFKDKPSSLAYAEAAHHKIGRYVHPGLPHSTPLNIRKEALKRLLSNDQTVAFGFTVFESFESRQVASTGIVPMPAFDEKELGGHEVLLVGYLKDEPEYGLCRNSWGSGWGLNGYFLMPWQYIANPQYSDDWRSIWRPAK